MEALLNYGALGVIVVLFVSGLIVPKPTLDRVVTERDKAEGQRDSLLTDVMEKVAPALERAAEAAKQREHFETDIREVLVDVRRILERGR